MSKRKYIHFLTDILKSSEKILTLIKDKSFDEFVQDWVVIDLRIKPAWFSKLYWLEKREFYRINPDFLQIILAIKIMWKGRSTQWVGRVSSHRDINQIGYPG